jgi:hypothetical protein
LAFRSEITRRSDSRSTKISDEHSAADEADANFTRFAIVKSIVADFQVRPSEQNFRQRERNAMLGLVGLVLRRIVCENHNGVYTPLA